MQGERLGELLVKKSMISADQWKQAKGSLDGKKDVGNVLIEMGFITEESLVSFLSKQYGVPAVDLKKVNVQGDVVQTVPKNICFKHHLIPVAIQKKTIVVAMANPSNIMAIDDVKFISNMNVQVVLATHAGIAEALGVHYGEESMDYNAALKTGPAPEEDEIKAVETTQEAVNLDAEAIAKDAPAVKLVNMLFMDAMKKGVSDIHVENYEKTMRVRFRIDGVLQPVMTPPANLRAAIVARIKILSKMDIAEKRLPQDGRIKLRTSEGKEVDIRVNVIPTLFGEKVCMRLLDKGALKVNLTTLGFEPDDMKKFKYAIEQPYGMVLVTGPTGSGKSTTLYSAMMELNKVTDNISTAEDPVEYNVEGINQVQMHEDIGLNFAAALRAFLRQDPDIIMVGEIRDFETAEIAIKAALTGHLVLSTLHTNDAPSTINRMIHMGVEPFLITSALNLIQAQRLVRRICDNCKEPVQLAPQDYKDIDGFQLYPDFKGVVYKGKGCSSCNNTGYRGRVGVYEVMPVSEAMKNMIIKGCSVFEIKRQAMDEGMRTLRMSAIKKVIEGATTVDEAIGASAPDTD